NSGKSQLVRCLTHALPGVADYPYTTRHPIPGMMIFVNVRLQLVDLPPISSEYTESWVPQVIRNADAALLVVDLSDDDVLERIEETEAWLKNAKVDLDQMKTLVIGNKNETPGASERETLVQEVLKGRFPITTISAAASSNAALEAFKRVVYDFL